MKKILALVMSLAICFCCSLTLFAAGTPEADYDGQEDRADVNVTINGEVTHDFISCGAGIQLRGEAYRPRCRDLCRKDRCL